MPAEDRAMTKGFGLCLGLVVVLTACGPHGVPKLPTPVPSQDPGNANAPGHTCAPGQVNAKGVGKPCHSREDCAGLWANFCDVVVSPRRPPMCSRMCDDDTDCGENAMCGVVNGVRHCYPKVCSEWTWTPGCEKTNPFCKDKGRPGRTEEQEEEEREHPPAHNGAVICAAGIAYSAEGFGLRCDKTSHARDGGACKGKPARACEATFNPDGPDYCTGECWNDATCGRYGYCGFHTPLKSFSFCYPRCPEPDHVAIKTRPAFLDVCEAEGGTVPKGSNSAGVGVRCQGDGDCAGNAGAKVCGSSLGTTRKTDVCTMGCSKDADCGRNAVCADLDFNAHGDGQASAGPRYCLPACWGQ
jgi:hypothetical protein